MFAMRRRHLGRSILVAMTGLLILGAMRESVYGQRPPTDPTLQYLACVGSQLIPCPTDCEETELSYGICETFPLPSDCENERNPIICGEESPRCDFPYFYCKP